MRRLDGAATSDFTDTHAVRNVSFWHGPIVQARRRTCYGEQLRRTCYGEQLRCGLPFRDVQDFGLFVITYFNNIVCTFRKWFRRIGMRPRGWRIGLLHSSCACHTQPSQALQFMSACCTPLAHVTHSPAKHCSSCRLAALLLRMSHTAQPGTAVHERGSTASARNCVAKTTGAMQFGRSCLNLDT